MVQSKWMQFSIVILFIIVRFVSSCSISSSSNSSTYCPKGNIIKKIRRNEEFYIRQQNLKQSKSKRAFKKVIGFDSRIEVKRVTGNFPWSAIGQVLSSGCPGMSFQTFTCTGTMIAPNVALTAAHCVTRPSGDCEMVVFTPGRSNRITPFGNLFVQKIEVLYCWKQGDYGCDFALLFFDERIGCQTGMFSYDSDCEQQKIQLIKAAGYPIDISQGDAMYFSSCRNLVLPECDGVGSFGHQCDTERGMSGSPLWTYDSQTNTRRMKGINRSARIDNLNLATRIGPLAAKWISQQIGKTESCT